MDKAGLMENSLWFSQKVSCELDGNERKIKYLELLNGMKEYIESVDVISTIDITSFTEFDTQFHVIRAVVRGGKYNENQSKEETKDVEAYERCDEERKD